jgi:hypothetical protein
MQFLNGMRTAILGIAIAVLIQSLSLYLFKRSEKYLVFLIILNYILLARIIRNIFPILSQYKLFYSLILLGQYMPANAGPEEYMFFVALRQIIIAFFTAYTHRLLYREFMRTDYHGFDLFNIPVMLGIIMLIASLTDIPYQYYNLIEQSGVLSLYVVAAVIVTRNHM